MTCFICCQCGTQFAATPSPPAACAICEDERQFVRWDGQAWTTMEELGTSHRLVLRDDAGIPGIGIEPEFAIGQRALLVRAEEGNVLWDCVSLVTDEIVAEVKRKGGLAAIAISHPHYYSGMAAWSEAFGDIPIYVHEDDRDWIMRPHRSIVRWSGETHKLGPSLTLIRCGGHFPGATVLHWRDGPGGMGALLTGDVLQVVPDRRHVSFMRSYPNLIPLNAPTVRRIAAAVEPCEYDRIYGAWWGYNILGGARPAVAASIARYLCAIEA